MSENVDTEQPGHVDLAVDIVAAYVSNNSVPSTDLPGLIAIIHGALSELAKAGHRAKAPVEALTAAQIRRSITKDHLVSFEDGKPYKTLRRHLTLRGLSPEAYRAKWGLPRDYPMTAQSYSAQRSELARALGLGQQRRKYGGAPPPAPEESPAAAPPKSRGRKKVSAE